jgi:hypothetical protein
MVNPDSITVAPPYLASHDKVAVGKYIHAAPERVPGSLPEVTTTKKEFVLPNIGKEVHNLFATQETLSF